MARSRTPVIAHSVRRVVPVLLACSALLATATACGGGGGSGGTAADQKVTLQMSWWGSDSRHTYTKKLIDMYQTRHPNITIKPTYSSFTDYWNKLATSVAGGNTPDIIQQDVKYVREYADRGALADLTPYLGKEIQNADFDPSVIDTGTVGGKMFAIPTGVNAYAIVANPAVFAKAKVPLPDDTTWTWEDLQKTAAAITAASPKGTYGMQDPGYVDTSLEIFARQRGETMFTPDNKLGLTKATVTAWFQYIDSLRDSSAEPVPSVTVETQNGGVDRSLTATGKGAMGVWWTNQLPALSKAAGGELKLLRLPGDAAKPGTFYKPAMFWSLSATSKHPKEAADFINFLLNDPDAMKLTLSDRGLPTNLKLRAAIGPNLTPADQASAAFLERIRATIGAQPTLPPKGAGKITSTVLPKTNEQVLFKKLTPEQAADQFLQQAAAALG